MRVRGRTFRSRGAAGLALAFACALLGPRASAGPPEKAEKAVKAAKVANAPYPTEFQARVRRAIERGVEQVRKHQLERYEDYVGGDMDDVAYEGAAAVTWVLRRAGVPSDDAAYATASRILRRRLPKTTDEASLLLLATCAAPLPGGDPFAIEAGTKEAPAALSKDDRIRAEGLVKLLLERQVAPRGARTTGLDRAYDDTGGWEHGGVPETYFALLALEAAARAGIPVPAKTWVSALRALVGWQAPKGPAVSLKRNEVHGSVRFEWAEPAHARGFGSFGTMSDSPTGRDTSAGAVALVVCQDALGESRDFPKDLRDEVRAGIRDALAWIQQHYDIRKNPVAGRPAYAGAAALEGPLYHHHWLQGLARLAVHLRTRHVGGHDWFQEGAEDLLKAQTEDGSWAAIWWENCYALLFLMRASLAAIAPVVTVSEPDPAK